MEGTWNIVFNDGNVCEIEFLKSGMFYQSNYYGTWSLFENSLAMFYFGNILKPFFSISSVNGYKFSGENSWLKWHALKQPNKTISVPSQEPKRTRSGKRY